MREAERGRRRSRRRQQAPGWGCIEEVQDCHGGEPEAFVESYLTSGQVRLFVSFRARRGRHQALVALVAVVALDRAVPPGRPVMCGTGEAERVTHSTL